MNNDDLEILLDILDVRMKGEVNRKNQNFKDFSSAIYVQPIECFYYAPLVYNASK